MASNDKVSAKILADAAKRVKEIEAESLEKRQKIEAQIEERKKAYLDETARLARVEQERIRREILSEARLVARRELLKARHELIAQILEKARERFTSSKSYPGLIARIVSEHDKTNTVVLSPNDAKRFRSFSWAKKAETAPIKGGVILRTTGRDINFSLDASFETLWETLSLEIARTLFEAPPSVEGRKKPKGGTKKT